MNLTDGILPSVFCKGGMSMLYLRRLPDGENHRAGQHRAAYDALAQGLWRE